jgi:hypothetical protein
MVDKNVYEMVRPILIDYLDGKIDIYQAAVKIVDTLFRWETHYMPLLDYNEDPWRLRNYDMLLIEDLIAICGEISASSESFVMCVSQEIVERFFNQ